MYSDMSMRTIARSSSNRNAASALVSSVLPTPVGPEEQERAHRPVRVLQSGARPAHRLRDRGDRLVLADDAGFQRLFHVQQLAALAFEHLLDRHPGPARHDRGDVLGGDRLLAHHPASLFGLGFGEPLFEVGDDAVGELAGPGPVAAALHLLQFDARLLQLLLQFLGAGQLLLLGLPLRGQFGRLLLELRQFLLQPLQPLARGRVGLLLQRLALDLQLHDAAVELVQFLGLRVDRHAQPRRGLVHQVDRLVGQKAVGDVAVGEGRGGDDRRVGDAHAVVQFVFFLDAPEDRDRVLDRGLADIDRLEAAFERGVLLDVLAVLVECRRADAVQFAARQRRFEHVGGVHRAFRLAGADKGVQLVDEQDDPFGARGDFLQYRLQPLLELAAVFGAGEHRAEIERQQFLVLEALRHVAIDDALRQPFDDRGLADPGLADQAPGCSWCGARGPGSCGGSPRRGR